MALTLTRTQQIIVVSALGVLVLGLVASLAYIVGISKDADVTSATYARMAGMGTQGSTSSTAAVATSSDDVNRMLFLIEEEKLAHDVYAKLYEKYNVGIFSNIARSETMHQARMLELLDSRGIDDPRSSDIGVFKNADLQKLYDTLIEQGYRSISDAYKVGVAIEEKDIADIEADLREVDATQPDILDTMDVLLRGSRNHLQSFNRQLG